MFVKYQQSKFLSEKTTDYYFIFSYQFYIILFTYSSYSRFFKMFFT